MHATRLSPDPQGIACVVFYVDRYCSRRSRITTGDALKMHVSAVVQVACGVVAQLGERRVRNAKVGSSILLDSTNLNKHFHIKHGAKPSIEYAP